MKVQMSQIRFKGFDRIQEVLMRIMFSNVLLPHDKVEIVENLEERMKNDI